MQRRRLFSSAASSSVPRRQFLVGSLAGLAWGRHADRRCMDCEPPFPRFALSLGGPSMVDLQDGDRRINLGNFPLPPEYRDEWRVRMVVSRCVAWSERWIWEELQGHGYSGGYSILWIA